MAKKLWIFIRLAVGLSFIIILRNFLWVFKFQYQTQNENSVDHVFPKEIDSSSREEQGVSNPTANSGSLKVRLNNVDKELIISAVTCGNRVNETFVMMKSALILSHYYIRFIIFADDSSLLLLKEKVQQLPHDVLSRIKLNLHPITFPNEHAEEWRKLFKPCASQRLFLPSLLQEIDSLLYMDTDTLFLVPPTKIWEHFAKMDSIQMAGVAPEHEDYATGWYNRFAKHPYYGNLGLNSGVMLMNLTRMRQFGWEKYIVPIYQEYKSKITWGDQDIINIVFHFHPEKLYVYPCNYNYRPDHCMYMSVCKLAEEAGVYVVHGNRGSFHNNKQPAFRAIYEAIEKYPFGSDLEQNLLVPLKNALEVTKNTNCGRAHHVFTKALEQLIRDN